LGLEVCVNESDDSLKWLEGHRVRLMSCEDQVTRVQPGTGGVVRFVDGMSTVHVDWDDGTSLGLIPGVDRWELDDGEEQP
jgi:hypothetical protein